MRDLPPPLPPGERTIGQVVAESIRAYGDQFWKVLPLGIPLAIVDQLCATQPALVQIAVYLAATPLFVLAYARACSLVYKVPINRTGVLVGCLIWIVFPFLRALFILPGLAWLAFIGLAVPAALVEKTGLRESLARGRALGRADYVHSLGSLATLVLVVGIADETLDRAPALAERNEHAHRAPALRRRSQPAAVHGRSPAVRRSGGAGRLAAIRPKETPRCRPTSSSRR